VKVLLDENLPHLLRTNLGDHDVFTVRYKGWASLKNGELLKTAEDDGFDVFITGDQTLSYEQNFMCGALQSWFCRLLTGISSRTICRPSSLPQTRLRPVHFRK
jgi:hypothetical protein